MGKIDLGLQRFGDSLMLGKFVSVVHGQRMDLIFDRTQCPYEYVGDVIGMLGADGLNASEASFSVHQGQQTATAVATIIRSTSQSPIRVFSLTMAGRSSIETRWEIEPLYADLDPMRFGRCC